jgi:hypothetical protein
VNKGSSTNWITPTRCHDELHILSASFITHQQHNSLTRRLIYPIQERVIEQYDSTKTATVRRDYRLSHTIQMAKTFSQSTS